MARFRGDRTADWILPSPLRRRPPLPGRPPTSLEVALAVAGADSEGDRALALVRARGAPRWLIERRLGALGPWRSGLYRPATVRHAGAALALDLGAAIGRLGTPIAADPERGILPRLRRALGRSDVRVVGIGLSRERECRVLMVIVDDGGAVAFAKIDCQEASLRRERDVLDALSRAGPQTFRVPRALDVFAWRGLTVLLLEAIEPGAFAARAFGEHEYAALDELVDLGPVLEPIVGAAEGRVPVHGDFAPWNTGRANGAYAVWDWEESRLGVPLEDYFHWHVQLLRLFGRGRLDELVDEARSPNPRLRALCRRLGLDDEAPLRALRACLERALARDSSQVGADDLSDAVHDLGAPSG